MKKQSGYMFPLEPTIYQETMFYQFAGCIRFIWNHALYLQNQHLDQGKFIIPYKDMSKLLTQWRKIYPFLKNHVAYQCEQQALIHLDRAIREGLNPENQKNFPVFKKKYKSSTSFKFVQFFKLDEQNGRIKLPKIGWVKYNNYRKIEGKVKNVTVSLQQGKWFISIKTDMEVDEPIHESKSAVGIDMGISNFATLSDGTFIKPLNSFKKHEKKLVKEERKLSRKKKFSKNWKKQKKKVERVHATIANVRKDFLHKLSTVISKSHATVIVEDLDIKEMSKSASGTKEKPGVNVAQKRKLNKAILDQGWGMFIGQLGYKLRWAGGELIKVEAANSSRECNRCGHVAKGNRISQAEFKCKKCGHIEHADLNAAKVIVKRGLFQPTD